MGREYKVIDADGHILEPVDIWDNYLEPAYHERAPGSCPPPGTASRKSGIGSCVLLCRLAGPLYRVKPSEGSGGPGLRLAGQRCEDPP